MYVKSIVPDFETYCNASQFNKLENLIGSVHKYAPEYVHVFVRDMGLSEGQKMLLKRYQNTKTISLTDIISEKTRPIDAEKEIVALDGKYEERWSNGKLVYVDSIRKQFQLAIVIPFIRSQLSKLINQLNLSKVYIPCENPSGSVDLIFYHSEGQHSSLDTDIREIKYVNKCYRRIHYLAANLTHGENRYLLGSFMMWQKLFIDYENNSMSLRGYGYTHFFLMEPDTRPIRQFWLDAIIDQITNSGPKNLYFSTNWWISGSAYRGSKMIGHRFLHINGNALYHLSPNFVAFIEIFSPFYLREYDMRGGYDLVLFSLLLKNHDLGKRFWHKFRFSDFIQNCWHTGCEGSDQLNNTQFILNNPNTYLIHGSFIEDDEVIEKLVDSTNKILLFCVVLSMIIIWRCRSLHRSLQLKRNIRFFFFRKKN